MSEGFSAWVAVRRYHFIPLLELKAVTAVLVSFKPGKTPRVGHF